jgi:hypothetical protein
MLTCALDPQKKTCVTPHRTSPAISNTTYFEHFENLLALAFTEIAIACHGKGDLLKTQPPLQGGYNPALLSISSPSPPLELPTIAWSYDTSIPRESHE